MFNTQQEVSKGDCIQKWSTLDNLKNKKRDLELRLKKVDEVISLFEENPNIAKAIDLLSQV